MTIIKAYSVIEQDRQLLQRLITLKSVKSFSKSELTRIHAYLTYTANSPEISRERREKIYNFKEILFSSQK